MAYNKKVKEINAKYMQNSQVRVPLNWLKSDFEGRVKPAILSTKTPISTYIKNAVNEKMIRDGLCRPLHRRGHRESLRHPDRRQPRASEQEVRRGARTG